ncbi:hypothetical protein FD724_39095 (plasmid) [Nostoc sp. C057]|uniref:hypothetical protein n=1 Tax=Nostoc sp. C057 TaxID=2576903 RepID=UPI00211839B7|nr:hypothetical protein [Nostoc sp. C057]QLE53844.1 hypothetical protein FD724_39095 [Nostoc sp. C057]
MGCWLILGAVARSLTLKEALRTRIGVNSPEAVFVVACKGERKTESTQAKSAVEDWFKWARRQRVVIAMSGEVVYTPEGKAVAVADMMRRYLVEE